jgi:hypothetical protein
MIKIEDLTQIDPTLVICELSDREMIQVSGGGVRMTHDPGEPGNPPPGAHGNWLYSLETGNWLMPISGYKGFDTSKYAMRYIE